MKEPLYILDGYSLIYRSYFAFMRNPLINSRGENISAVFGFFRTFFSLYNQYNPKFFSVAMDSLGPTFRHKKYPKYKATREKAPDDLHSQVPIIEDILNALEVPILRKNGYEADDIMATLAEQCKKENRSCFLISGDKDLLQTIEGPVKMLLPEKGDYRELGREEVYDKLGVYPEQIIDYLSLIGDSADNIPGVKGIGPKTAVSLLEKYETLDAIYENLDSIPSGQRKKLEEDRDSAYLSRELIVLDLAVPLDFSSDQLSIERLKTDAAVPLFIEQEIKSIAEELGGKEPVQEQSGLKREKADYSTILSIEELDVWVEKIRKKGWFAFDVETDSLDSLTAKPLGFSLSIQAGEACYVPLEAPDAQCLPHDAVKERLRQILQDTELSCIGQNIKYDHKVMARWGIPITNIGFDTMIAAWILDSQAGSYGMDNMAARFLNHRTLHFDEVVAKGETFESVPVERATSYAAEDADITFRLFELFKPRLVSRGLEKVFYEVETALVPILAEMELTGITLDSRVMAEYSRELEGELAELEDEIYKLCGEIFNINSTKQLQTILFQKRKLQPVRKTKTGFSTDNSVLEELAKEDPVPELVLRHRSKSKLKSTYVDALPKLVNRTTKRLHTHFIQTGTATGRLSSRDPNLQNIPIKTEEGRRIRQAFVPAEGAVFLSADYSQIELVILAHLSHDPVLCRAFRDGMDVHRQTGALIFDVPVDEVTPEQRRVAKVINFGIMYGMSGFRLSRELGIPRAHADSFIHAYFQKYATIKKFIENTVKEVEKTEISKTLLGRERKIPGINSKNRTEKMSAERIAVNTPIQGSAADIVKLAMLAIDRRMKSEKLRSKLLLQVHDELIFEVPEDERETMIELTREEMEKAVTLDVPLKVSVETGYSWGEMH